MYRVLVIGYGLLAIGYRLSDIGYRVTVIGYNRYLWVVNQAEYQGHCFGYPQYSSAGVLGVRFAHAIRT